VTSASRQALVFSCGGSRLVGVLHRPPAPARVGVVIVVGGPQYRVGSHRQFVYLADDLARAGYTTLRFDYRGMGDSEGPFRGFEDVADDIDAAVTALRDSEPSVEAVVLWGLCDAATAVAFYAAGHGGVAGLALANPWIRTQEGLARSYVENYYGQRLLDRAFWQRVLTGRMPVVRRVREFLQDWRSARRAGQEPDSASLPDRMRRSLEAYTGPVLLLMSGADLTAGEFNAAASGPDWSRWRCRREVVRIDFPDADHTFSRRDWMTAVNAATVRWLDGLRRH
jgi:exosortase A-associated hydrolase 1